MITVLGRADSSAVARVMWTLGEIGQPHRRIDTGGAHGGLDAPAYRAMNPPGRIPTLVFEDGVALWESNAIIRCLAALNPEAGLLAQEARARAQIEAWMDWSEKFARDIGKVRAAYKTPGASAEACRGPILDAAGTVAVLDGQLSKRTFVMGDRLSAADLALGVAAHRWMRCPPELDLPDFPHLRAWYAELALRAPFREHVMKQVSAGPQPIGGHQKVRS